MVRARQEVDAVVALLHQPDIRLLTLTGPGGVDRTRLALAAANEVAGDFADGICFVPLAPVADAALVPSASRSAAGPRPPTSATS